MQGVVLTALPGLAVTGWAVRRRGGRVCRFLPTPLGGLRLIKQQSCSSSCGSFTYRSARIKPGHNPDLRSDPP